MCPKTQGSTMVPKSRRYRSQNVIRHIRGQDAVHITRAQGCRAKSDLHSMLELGSHIRESKTNNELGSLPSPGS